MVANLFSNYINSYGQAIKINNIIISYGSVSSASPGTKVTFPYAYKNTPSVSLSAQTAYDFSGIFNLNVGMVNNKTFEIAHNYHKGITIYWIAIGY